MNRNQDHYLDQRALEFFEAWVAQKNSNGQWTEKTLGVGGFFRDQQLGRDPYDLDLVVEAPGGAEKFAHLVAADFPDSISKPHQLGKSYPIWELSFKAPLKFNQQTFDLSGVSVQIADTQKESFMNPQSRQRVTTYGTLEEDCRRRDFTVNMIYWDLRRRELIDPSGHALIDLQRKVLQTHPKVDAHKIFSDDPLRILRLFRFQAQLGFQVLPDTLAAAQACCDRLSILSGERMRDEMNKAALTCGLAPMIRAMDQSEVLEKIFPEFLPMKNCAQDPLYHSEGDVFVHTLMVMDRAPRTVVLQWAALLHDVGKPNTQTFEGTRIKFIGHEVHSEAIGRRILERLVFSKEQAERIALLVRLHLRGGDATQWKSAKPARRLLRELGEAESDWWELVQADSQSSIAQDGKPRLAHLEILKTFMTEASRVPISKKPILSGQRIMTEFQILPGPLVGELMLMAQEIEDDLLLSKGTATAEEVLGELRVRRLAIEAASSE